MTNIRSVAQVKGVRGARKDEQVKGLKTRNTFAADGREGDVDQGV